MDNLQWAEPVFVELVEHVADLSRGAPIFLLCIARTEFLEMRPAWGGGKLNATSLLLEALGDEECAELIERLVPDAALDPGLRARIASASAGNPLYVEEMLAMVRAHGEGEVSVPPRFRPFSRHASTLSITMCASCSSAELSRARSSIGAPSPSSSHTKRARTSRRTSRA